MEELEKIVLFGDLYELYGKLLPKAQVEVGDLYFNSNLTITEIANSLSKSRQAVYDTLKKTEKKLLEIESKVGALEIIKKLKGN